MTTIEINYLGQPKSVPLKLNPDVLDQFVEAHPVTKNTLRRIEVDYTKTIANHSKVLGDYSLSSRRMRLYPEKFTSQPGDTMDQLLETSLHELYHAKDPGGIMAEKTVIGIGFVTFGFLICLGAASATTVEINNYTLPQAQVQGIIELITAIPRVKILQRLLEARWLPTERRADTFSKNPENKSQWQNLVYLDTNQSTRRHS